MRHNITVEVSIQIAPEFLAQDNAMLKLRTGISDKNVSKYSEEEFKKQIEKGNIIVAMLREDPIAYAVIEDGKIIEHYIQWSFKDTELENILLNTDIAEI